MDTFIYYSGWVGIVIGQFVPWFQIIKIRKSRKAKDVSINAYIFLVAAIVFYLLHAIDIGDLVFIVAQCLALFSNALALFLIYKNR